MANLDFNGPHRAIPYTRHWFSGRAYFNLDEIASVTYRGATAFVRYKGGQEEAVAESLATDLIGALKLYHGAP